LDGEEIVSMEIDALKHPGVQAEIAKLKLPEGSKVIIDPWIYGICYQRRTKPTC